jgi:flagellar biosynthetic protein FliR
MDLAGLLQLPPQGLVVFLLILFRTSSLFLTAPVLGNTSVPPQVKMGLAFLVSAILTPLWAHHPLGFAIDNPLELALATLQEIALGVMLGLLSQLFFVAVQFAGQVIGLQMGFGIASIFDPQSQTQVAITAQIYTAAAILVFLLLDGHLWILMALNRSLSSIPLGTFIVNGHAVSMLINATNDMFWIALTLMAPVLGVLALTELALALVARIMPQMNVFVAAFPVKIGLGIFTMAISFPLIVSFMSTLVERNFSDIFRFLGS